MSVKGHPSTRPIFSFHFAISPPSPLVSSPSPPLMCFRRKTLREDSHSIVLHATPPSSPNRHSLQKPCRSDSDLQKRQGSVEVRTATASEQMSEASGGPESLPGETPRKKPIYQSDSIPNEKSSEQVQNRLVPVIKNLFDLEPLSKTGGSSDLLAEKLAQKNKLDEEKDLKEMTCEEDCNYYNIRKDIRAIVDKSINRKEDDTVYDKNKKAKGKETVKKPLGIKYKKDLRQSKSKEEKTKSVEKVASVEYDTENDVNEKNHMYNLREIDYCTHDMMRCIEEENLYKNINSDSKLPEKVEPYGDLEQLAKRKYTSCKVLRRNTLMSTLLSMPSADEKEYAATATAKHMSEHCAIRFLPPTTLIQHCEEMREDMTNIDASDLAITGTAIALTAAPATAVPIVRPSQEMENSKKRDEKKKKKEGKMAEITCESEKKTAEEM